REAVRVDADRLDLLVETIGELVIAEAMVSQSGELRAGASVEVARNLDHLDKICRELQEIGMALRMVPVRPIFQKMARLARDLSRKVNRSIEFTMSGEDTELDKPVVDKIGDPLVHMIRNAVDHGIESDPAEREALGKSRTGNIRLTAYHKGGNIVIEVQDDGKGLDRERIMAKAVERGLVKEGQVLSDREVFNLIFEPGFSTAKQVTDVSGRGVGMDVVRRNVEELRGSVEIESTMGKGSIFRFKLPLTLAIIDGMVIRTGAENYIIPTLSVVRLVRPNMEDYLTVRSKGEMLRFEEELVPLVRLNRVFNVPAGREDLSDTVVVVVESEGRRIGLISDDLIGQQQIVIKSLGEKVQGTPGIAGGAIMSDGHVALILDVPGLVKVAQKNNPVPERESHAG
ncbi:chemotaxis protein CheA, partial [bacterium]|nr:chemotaxis protein CheA [bacterium]